MKKIPIILVSLCAATFVFSGCSRATCNTIEDACGGGEDAVDECIDDYRDGNADCRRAMRDMADCVDEQGCGDASCVGESLDVLEEC